jgi:hypothetical protein
MDSHKFEGLDKDPVSGWFTNWFWASYIQPGLKQAPGQFNGLLECDIYEFKKYWMGSSWVDNATGVPLYIYSLAGSTIMFIDWESIYKYLREEYYA